MPDWNIVLSYDTVKIMRIQDWRLGLIHYSLIVAILVYIVGISVVGNKNFVKKESPIGSVRLVLTDNENYVRLPPQQLPYCTAFTGGDRGLYNISKYVLDCAYWDDILTQYPPTENMALFLTTRVKIINQWRSPADCSLMDPQCSYVEDPDPPEQYIAQVEELLLKIDHGIYAQHVKESWNVKNLPGFFVDQNGNKIPLQQPEQVGVPGDVDYISVKNLLYAAGVNLDTLGGTKPKRSEGIVLLMFIDYSNLDTYNLNYYRYKISVTAISDTKYAANQTIWQEPMGNRTVLNRHGIRIVALQSGSIAVFDFQTMLINLVSGLGLMAVATVIVDALATKVLPRRAEYADWKYDEHKLGIREAVDDPKYVSKL